MDDALRTVALASETDLDGFRRIARGLLAEQVAPERVGWTVHDRAEAELFGPDDGEQGTEPKAGVANAPEAATAAPTAKVPSAFLELCERVVLHSDPGRFGLMYRLLWRLLREPGLRDDPLDADRVQARHMAQAVKRDMHKMTAFVRFRPIHDPAADGGAAPLHVAWFEPEHHIVLATAPFFMRRFAQMRWAILTPERCLRWDGHTLEVGPGATRDEAPAPDAGEQLWLTYYAHIFNPARLKLAMMKKEMPRKYWHNLPEAQLITPLAAAAHARSGRMVEQAPTTPARRLPDRADSAPARGRTEDPAMTIAPAVPLASPVLLRLHDGAQRCRDCPIGAHASQAVFGEGPLRPALMLVGEQPGDQEDLRGRPFVGPAGQLLDRGLQQLGWPRDALYVTNAVKHFKFELRGKRRLHKTPEQREVAACSQWLEAEIAEVRPRAAVALGATAARALLQRPVPVMKTRGQWLQRDDGLRVLVTLHPSALLRMEPELKEDAFAQWLDDLRAADAVMVEAR